jgi:biotin carboxylase
LEERVRLTLVASKPTDSVTFGFLPAAARLGLDVVLVTDQAAEHERVLAKSRLLPRPGCVPLGAEQLPGAGPVRIVDGDVWDARRLVSAIAGLPAQDAIFSNSDHLQTQTALAAAYFDVPGKDWRSAMRAKNKPLMRRRLAGMGIEHVAATEIHPGGRPTVSGLTYPVVLKPAEGVASEDVVLVRDAGELSEQCALIFARRPGEVLLAEQYLPGQLRTLETLSDGAATWVLGGFRTRLSPLPFFIEERLTWDAAAPEAASEHVTRALTALGATFGACHTEYVTDRGHPPALVEVNDRVIGDHGDFLLSDLLGVDLFERVLRLYLGEPLPPGPPPGPAPDRAHAVIDYVVAERPGVLATSPRAGARLSAEPGVLLSYRPLHEEGDRIEVTHTNRDYLGVITAIGPGAAAVNRSVAALRAAEDWKITESR